MLSRSFLLECRVCMHIDIYVFKCMCFVLGKGHFCVDVLNSFVAIEIRIKKENSKVCCWTFKRLYVEHGSHVYSHRGETSSCSSY